MIINQPGALINKPIKIVSLVPSQTELLSGLGLDKEIIGITKFCVHPAGWAKTKRIIGGTKNLHIEKIQQLKPDLIIANKEENVKEQIELLAQDFPVWVTDVNSLNESLIMINDIGRLTHTRAKAAGIVTQVKNNFNQIHQCKKKIACCYLIWQNPYMTVGGDTFINDMMRHCGLYNIYSNEKHYPQVNLEDLKTKNCKLLLLSSEPFPFKQKHLDELQVQLPFSKILLVNGEFFSWYGSRLIKAPSYFNTIIDQLDL